MLGEEKLLKPVHTRYYDRQGPLSGGAASSWA